MNSLCYVVQAQLAEQERQKLLRTQATKYAQHQAGLAASAAATHTDSVSTNPQLPQAFQDTTMPAADAAAVHAEEMSAVHAASPSGDSETSGRKRRRTAVDYVALNKQLEAEAAGPSRQSGSQPRGHAADISLNFVTAVPASAVGVQATNAVPNQRPDTPLDGTALNVGQQNPVSQQPHEGDRLS